MQASQEEEKPPKQVVSTAAPLRRSTRKASQSEPPDSQKRVRFNPTPKVLNTSQSESTPIDFTKICKLEKVAITLFEGDDDEGDGNRENNSFESLFPKRHSTPRSPTKGRAALVESQRLPVKYSDSPVSPWQMAKRDEQRNKEKLEKKSSRVTKNREPLSMSLENGIQRIVQVEKRKLKKKNYKTKVFDRDELAKLQQMIQVAVREELRGLSFCRQFHRPTEVKGVQVGAPFALTVSVGTRQPTQDRAVQTEAPQTTTVGVNTLESFLQQLPHVCEHVQKEMADGQPKLNRTAPTPAIKRRRASVPVNVTLPPEAGTIEQPGQRIRCLRSRRISSVLEVDEEKARDV